MSENITKTTIADALLELLKDYDLKEVSCIDIIERSLISKGTFYKYFKDKEDIFRFLCLRFFKELSIQVKNYEESFFKNPSLFAFMNCHKSDFHALLNAYEDKEMSLFYLKERAKECFEENDGLLLDVLFEFLNKEEDCTLEGFLYALKKREKEAENSLYRLRRFLK